MKILLFSAVGFLLLSANWWYVRSFCRTFFGSAIPDVISPFQFVGTKDEGGVKGQAMARLLAARLASLQREVSEAELALQDATLPPAPRQDGNSAPPPVDRARPIELDARVINVPALQLSVSGVDVSGLFAWAYRGIAEGRAIKVTVHSPEGAKAYTVAANLDTPGLGDIWITDVDPNDIDTVEQIAVDILRQHAMRLNRIPEAAALDRKEFSGLIRALRKSADLNHKLQHGGVPTNSEYNTVVAELEPLIARMLRWRVLLELAAKTAENGRDLGKAVDFYKRQLALLDEGEGKQPLSIADKAKRKAIEAHIVKLEAALNPAGPPLEVAVAAAAADTVVEYPLNLLAIPQSAPSGSGLRVAIVGGVPLPEQLKALGKNVEILSGGNQQETTEPDRYREHTGNAASVVRSVAPESTLLFTPMQTSNGGLAVGQLAPALAEIFEAKPDVVLIPLNSLDKQLTVAMALEHAANATVIVVAAGNDGPDNPAQFAASPLASRILVVDAIDDNGLPAHFASKSDHVVWAPGVNIPVHTVDERGKLVRQTMSGTTFSAALAAGIAVRLKAADANLMPPQIVDRLRSTSKPLATGGPKVLQLAAALNEGGQ